MIVVVFVVVEFAELTMEGWVGSRRREERIGD